MIPRKVLATFCVEKLKVGMKDNSKKEDKFVHDNSEKIEIIEESLKVDKVNEAIAEVTINKDVEYFDEVLEIPIKKEDISIEHVSVGKVIENYPSVREEDGKTIIPVVKERLVVTKQLFLEEEIHISKSTNEEIQEVKETLRKDVVDIQNKKL